MKHSPEDLEKYIHQTLRGLPLVLYHFEDMPYEDIAKKLGVSLAKVKTDILRARTALAAIIARSGTRHENFAPDA